jgi:hypothetical protein
LPAFHLPLREFRLGTQFGHLLFEYRSLLKYDIPLGSRSTDPTCERSGSLSFLACPDPVFGYRLKRGHIERSPEHVILIQVDTAQQLGPKFLDAAS